MISSSDYEIATIFAAQSDSDSHNEFNNARNKLQGKRNSKLLDTENVTSDTSTDIKNLFDCVKYKSEKINISQKERVSLRIKFKRSTEQSLYKIDTSSECEQPSRNLRDRRPKQKKKSYSEIESEKICIDSEDSSISQTKDEKKLVQMTNEDKVLTRTRNRKPPLRLSAYHCGSLDSLSRLENRFVNSPSRRNRKNIDYNEDKLLINAIMCNVKMEDKRKQKENKDTNVFTDKCNTESGSLKSNLRQIKRNRISSVKDSENDSGIDSEIIKMKSMKKSNDSESKAHNESNPRRDRRERIISENMQRNVQLIDNSKDDSEGEVISIVPVKTDKQKRAINENTLKSIQIVNDAKNNDEEECLTDMYKRIKISSPKNNISMLQRRSNMQKSIQVQLEKTHLSTPKSCSIKHSTLTPSMGKRNSALLKPVTPLQEARSRLHVSAVPKSLPCREEEFNNIFTFLKRKLEDKNGGCIYISGVPGTGKTATVNEAVRCLQKLIIKGQLDDFDYVTINGMKLTEPRQSYVQILKQLDGKSATWEQAYRILEKRFHNTNSKMTLLLVDELDFLCTKRQDVVYNLLDWPTKATAQLIVVTIANTMDLPERVLMGRVTSRLGLTRLTFQPYNYKQLQEIVMSRLKNFNGFRSEAVQLVARKVSAVSGDARRALDICRHAMEIAESRNAETISLEDVTEAVSEMIASAKVQAIKHCSKMEQIFLQAVSAEVARTSVEEVYFNDAYRQLESLCSFDGIKIPTVTEILAVCGRLGASRLLISEHSKNDIYQKILLNVSTDDIHYALQELYINLK